MYLISIFTWSTKLSPLCWNTTIFIGKNYFWANIPALITSYISYTKYYHISPSPLQSKLCILLYAVTVQWASHWFRIKVFGSNDSVGKLQLISPRLLKADYSKVMSMINRFCRFWFYYWGVSFGTYRVLELIIIFILRASSFFCYLSQDIGFRVS